MYELTSSKILSALLSKVIERSSPDVRCLDYDLQIMTPSVIEKVHSPIKVCSSSMANNIFIHKVAAAVSAMVAPPSQ